MTALPMSHVAPRTYVFCDVTVTDDTILQILQEKMN